MTRRSFEPDPVFQEVDGDFDWQTLDEVKIEHVKGWYVVRSSDCSSDGDCDCWTISPSKTECGWHTDCGYPGYGLPRKVAEFIVHALNNYRNPPA